MTTQGWFLSRAISSSTARRCVCWVLALIVSSENVVYALAAEEAAAEADVQADRGGLVDDDDALWSA